MVNAKGGINGRKLSLISLDDGYSPPKALELTRKLVEGDGVAFIFGSLGTAINKTTQRYLNGKGVPQLLISSPDQAFGDPEHFPWTMGWQSTTELEGTIFGKYIRQSNPAAKVGALYQNDDFGKGYLSGLRRGLGEAADKFIVATASYETSDGSIDSQITSLRAAGADTFVNIAIAEIRRPGHPPGLRHRVEADAVPRQCLQLRRPDAAARWIGQGHRVALSRVLQGPDRPAMGRRSCHGGLAYLARSIRSRGRCHGRQHRSRLQPGSDHGANPDAVRQRSLPRQHHAPGRQPEGFGAAAAPAWHPRQYLADQFPPRYADAALPLRGRTLAVGGRRAQWLNEP